MKISRLSAALSSAAATLTNSGSSPFVADTAQSGLKRQASVRKLLTLSKKKTFTVNFKLQVDSIFDSMRRTKCNFVFCVLPGGKESSTASSKILTRSSSNETINIEPFEVPLVRSQLRAYQILPACRIYRQGMTDQKTVFNYHILVLYVTLFFSCMYFVCLRSTCIKKQCNIKQTCTVLFYFPPTCTSRISEVHA